MRVSEKLKLLYDRWRYLRDPTCNCEHRLSDHIMVVRQRTLEPYRICFRTGCACAGFTPLWKEGEGALTFSYCQIIFK